MGRSAASSGSPRFVIVGAGMAGILSAIKLADAGFDDFPTGDEQHDEDPSAKLGFGAIVKRVLSSPVIRVLLVAEFCTGLVRQGLLLYFTEFLTEVHGVKPGTDLFDVASIVAFEESLRALLAQIVERPDVPILALALASRRATGRPIPRRTTR